VKRLGDGVAAVRQNAAIALGSIGGPDAFEPLVEALQEGAADLRFQAATSLAEIDPARAYEPVAAALADADNQVVAAAALSLGAIGDKRAVPLLVPKLEHADASTRFDVAYALAELGHAAGKAILVEALVDVDRAWDAVTALSALGSEVATLRGALVNKKVPPEATVLAAGIVLAADPTDEAARRVLLAGLAARKVHVRGLAVEQLGLAAGGWAKEPLEKLAKSGKGFEVLDAITTALKLIDDREGRRP
jgi:HEAT repeat protein